MSLNHHVGNVLLIRFLSLPRCSTFSLTATWWLLLTRQGKWLLQTEKQKQSHSSMETSNTFCQMGKWWALWLPCLKCYIKALNGAIPWVVMGVFSRLQVYHYAGSQITCTTYPSGLEVLHFPNKQIGKRCCHGSLEVWDLYYILVIFFIFFYE